MVSLRWLPDMALGLLGGVPRCQGAPALFVEGHVGHQHHYNSSYQVKNSCWKEEPGALQSM